MTLRGALLALSLALTVHPACAANPGQSQVDTALAADTRADRIAALEQALAEASSKEEDLIALHLAEQRRLNGDAEGAVDGFKKIRKGDLGRAAELGQALAELAMGKDRMDVLLQVSPKISLDTMNADRYAVLAQDHAKRGEQDMARRLKSMALDYARSDAAVLRRLEKALANLAEPGSTGATVDAAQTPGSGDPRIDTLDAAVEAGDRARVAELAAELAASAEEGSDAARIAQYAERRVGLEPDPRTIAVLLPMSGKYRGVGAVLRGALEMGWKSGGGTGRNLVFIDTGPDQASARAALEKAIFAERAIAVVGPVRSDLADDLAAIADATRTPLLGLHQSGSASRDRTWALDGIATARVQVDGLVSHLMDTEDMEAFAIFAPDSSYGRSAAEAFRAAVEARGGSIAVEEYYDNEATDLIPFAKKLGRKDYKARAAEWREVRKTIEEAGGDPSRAVLPPVIDFDAIFIPDKHRRIPVAAAGLAYEEFPIGEFQITKDGPTVPLVGLSGWNNPELVTTGGPYVRGSRFVDVFLPDASDSAAFVQAYQAEAGKTPNTLEAQTYTVGKVIAAAARQDADSKPAFLQALLDAEVASATATGATGIAEGRGWVNHRVRILTLDKEGIREIDPPTPPEGDGEPEAGE